MLGQANGTGDQDGLYALSLMKLLSGASAPEVPGLGHRPSLAIDSTLAVGRSKQTQVEPLLEQAVQHAVEEAAVVLGYRHFVAGDCPKAVEFYAIAADRGIGHCDRTGRQDFRQQLRIEGTELGAGWHAKAASEIDDMSDTVASRAFSGDSYSKGLLGYLHLIGRGITQSADKALTFLRQGHGEGDCGSSLQLGWMHFNGNGVARNLTKAVEFFRRSIGLGCVAAANSLAVLYLNGYGVSQVGFQNVDHPVNPSRLLT